MLKAYIRARPKTSALDDSLQELWHVFLATSDQRARDDEPTGASGLQRKHEILMDTFVKLNRSHVIMIGQDSAAGRQKFERQMERRRLEAVAEEALKPLRRGWYLGSEQFKEQMLELMEGKLGESHSGELHRKTAEQRANRFIAPGRAGVRVGHSPAQRPRQAGQRCPAAERNDPADQVDCGLKSPAFAGSWWEVPPI
jgi:hypothetical protein